MSERIIFDLKLPEGTKCLAMSNLNDLCIACAFDVPKIGTQIYILNPNTGKCVLVDMKDSE